VGMGSPNLWVIVFFPGIGRAGEPLEASELWDSRKWWANVGVVVGPEGKTELVLLAKQTS